MGKGFTHESTKSGTVEWYTPPWVFERLGLFFSLDPCHPEGDRLPWVPAGEVYTRKDNGLVRPWFGRVWCNPPYDDTETWLRLFAEQGHGVSLVFSRTETGWFHEIASQADAVCFAKGRIPFVDRTGSPPRVPDKTRPGKLKRGSPGAGSVFIAFGADCVEALHRSNLGIVYERPRGQVIALGR